jgi:hypothetical protein
MLIDKRSKATGGAGVTQHALVLQIESADFIAIELRVRKATQLSQVDVRLIVCVMAGDEAGEHARVRGDVVFGNESDAHARDGVHAEHFQHRDVRMAATKQDEFFGYGRDGIHSAQLNRKSGVRKGGGNRNSPANCLPAAKTAA